DARDQRFEGPFVVPEPGDRLDKTVLVVGGEHAPEPSEVVGQQPVDEGCRSVTGTGRCRFGSYAVAGTASEHGGGDVRMDVVGVMGCADADCHQAFTAAGADGDDTVVE